jgi:hypothetical protein
MALRLSHCHREEKRKAEREAERGIEIELLPCQRASQTERKSGVSVKAYRRDRCTSRHARRRRACARPDGRQSVARWSQTPWTATAPCRTTWRQQTQKERYRETERETERRQRGETVGRKRGDREEKRKVMRWVAKKTDHERPHLLCDWKEMHSSAEEGEWQATTPPCSGVSGS